jgi:hypothetical protein
VLTYLYDYIHGIDFEDEIGSEFSFRVHVATQRSAATHLRLYRNHEDLDFRRFSKVYRGVSAGYDFSLAAYERLLDGAPTSGSAGAGAVSESERNLEDEDAAFDGSAVKQ